MAWLLIRDLLLFGGALAGLGAPWLPCLKAWPALERLALAAGAALITGWLAGFSLYAAGLSLRWFWLAPALGLGFTLGHSASFRELVRETAVRRALAQWGVLALWCLGWHALVVSYSGAAWQADWYEHYDRAHFFLAHWPRDFLFVDLYPLPARPPLVNLWAGLLLAGAGGDFYHYQVFMTLLSSLVFLPLAVLARRWRDEPRTGWLLLILLLANPLLVQNATFPWTKLAAAFFVLLAWIQLTPAPGDRTPGRLVAAALAFAGGMLAHYSTGPWLIALGIAWLATQRSAWRQPAVRREALVGAGLAALVLLSWVGWSAVQYGVVATFTQNTTLALAPARSAAELLAATGRNFLHTLNPITAGGIDYVLLAQQSALGRLRDTWFIAYQLRLGWTLGSAGALALAWLVVKTPAPAGSARRFGWIAVLLGIGLGIAVHTPPDELGLAHISLQPLVLLALAWLAAHAPRLPRWLRLLYAAGLVVDLLAGIALHFLAQSGWPGPWSGPDAVWFTYTRAAGGNYQSKLNLGLVFLADRCPPAGALVLILLAGTLAALGWRLARPRGAIPPAT